MIRFESAEHFAIARQTMDRLKAAGVPAAAGYELLSPQAISHAAAFTKVPPEVLPMPTRVETPGRPTHGQGPNTEARPFVETPERYARIQSPDEMARARALLQRTGELPHPTAPLLTPAAPRPNILSNILRPFKRGP